MFFLVVLLAVYRTQSSLYRSVAVLLGILQSLRPLVPFHRFSKCLFHPRRVLASIGGNLSIDIDGSGEEVSTANPALRKSDIPACCLFLWGD